MTFFRGCSQNTFEWGGSAKSSKMANDDKKKSNGWGGRSPKPRKMERLKKHRMVEVRCLQRFRDLRDPWLLAEVQRGERSAEVRRKWTTNKNKNANGWSERYQRHRKNERLKNIEWLRRLSSKILGFWRTYFVNSL